MVPILRACFSKGGTRLGATALDDAQLLYFAGKNSIVTSRLAGLKSKSAVTKT